MVINKEYTAVCRGCGATISLYNYVGLDARSLMGSHHCGSSLAEYLRRHPHAKRTFDKLKEVKPHADHCDCALCR